MSVKGQKYEILETRELRRRIRQYSPNASVPLMIASFGIGMVAASIAYFSYMKIKRERFWREFPGERFPPQKPLFYFGPWKGSVDFWKAKNAEAENKSGK
eukprot:ANDGO_03196.mRNA.1 hypothetical protein